MLLWLLFVALKVQSLALKGLPVGTYKQVALFVNLKTNKKQLDLHFPNAVPYDSVPLSFFFLAPPFLGREDNVLHQFCCPPSGSSSPSSR